MRKAFGAAIIVFLSVGLVAGMAYIGNQRQTAQLEAQAEAYANLKPSKHSAAAGTSAEAAPSSKISKGQALNYVAMGDDIAAGRDTKTEKAAYPYLVAAALSKQRGFTVTMSSVAKSGATIGTGGLPNVSSVVAKHPNVVTIQYGNNEQTAAGSTAALYQANLTKLVRDLQAKLPKAKIILLTPWTPNAAFKRAVVAAGQTTGALVVDLTPIEVAKNTSAAAGTTSWAGPASGKWPNNDGNAQIARAIEQTVTQ
jgi:acyl-CoA thioesterase-1